MTCRDAAVKKFYRKLISGGINKKKIYTTNTFYQEILRLIFCLNKTHLVGISDNKKICFSEKGQATIPFQWKF
jgi:hypothetical protein